MPQEQQLAHRNVTAPGLLPYITNTSPTVTDPYYCAGSFDLLTGIDGILRRRPGFSDNVEVAPTVFNNLQRLFTWDRFDGTFIVMACDVNASGFAQVFKMVLGSDSRFVSIFTDTAATPFDFVVSNNTVYFSNGNVAKKWNPAIGLQNWGIAIGSVNNATGPTIAGAGSNVSRSQIPWATPSNVTSNVSFATCSSGGQPITTDYLFASTFGFSISSANTVNGVQISFQAQSPGGNETAFFVQLVKAGNAIGTPKQITITPTLTTFTLGGTSDLWGASFTPNDINQTNWGVYFYGAVAHLHNSFAVNDVTATIYGLGGPSVTVSGTAGSFSATVGYEYVFCYGNSNTGHLSSPTPVSASTGVFTNKLNVQVSLTASTDAQVNQIRVFRTTDSAAPGTTGGTFFELPTSPYPNTTANITDNAVDTSLIVSSVAPLPGFNDPPPPMRGLVYFVGRICGFANNKSYFSGLEEIPNGVPEESFVSGVAGNFWTFDQPVQAHGIAGSVDSQIWGVLCGGRVYGISGNTLDTFRRFTISNRRGCRNVTCVSMLGAMCAWLDSSMQVWATDGSSLQEIGKDIRPSLAGLNPANFSLTFHVSGTFHWLVLSTGTQLFIYDMDLEQWMPPWSFSAKYVFSGETSPGNYVLMASNGTKALQLNANRFNDNGTNYQPIGQTNLFAMVPDYGRRFSYIGVGSYDEPSRTGWPWIVQVDNNRANSLTDVGILTDEDPTKGTYTSIATNVQGPETSFNRKQGTNLIQNVYQTNGPAARWASLQFKMPAVEEPDKIYGYYVAYKPLGGR